LLLSVVMVIGLISMISFTAFAAEAAKHVNTYLTQSSTIAPGVTQTINEAYRDDGKFVKYYVAVADLSDPNVGIHATYGGAQGVTPGVSKMTDQIKDMTALHTNPEDTANYIENYAIVAGVNGDGYNVGTGAPSGAHVMNGVAGFGIVKAGNSPWFAQFADGYIACGRNNTDWDAAVAEHGAVQEAIGGFQLLMKDGVVYEPGTAASQGGSTYWKPGFNYPCSFVGVTEEGKLILINCDGNNMGGSIGFDYDYTIDVALKLGVKDLLCLDGGGSATYLSRPEGESEIQVTSKPSDGSERAVANGLVIYSTVAPSNVFSKAVLSTDNTYYTPYSSVTVGAKGVSPAGTPVEIPADVQWTLSDDSFGTIANGVFTSTGKTGTVKLQMVYSGAVVGETEVQIVNPTTVAFEQDTMVVPFGKTAKVKMVAEYLDAETNVTFPVTFKASDFTFSFSKENTGSLNGFELIAPEEGAEAAVTLYASYNYAQMDTVSIAVSYGKASEIVWDFEDGDISNWLGWEAAKKWALENAPNSALGLEASGNDNNGLHGNTPGTNNSYTFLATAGNGQVRNGKYALGFTLDETHYNEYGQWEYNILFNVEGQTVLRDVANGKNATTLGMWIYVPEDLTGVRYTGDTGYFAMEGQFYCGSSASNVKDYRVRNFVFQDTGKTMASTTDAGYTEVGKWVYMSADISGYDYVSLQNPTGNIYREPSFIRFYFKDLMPNKYTFYFDDITLDYSSAVEDRDAPVISDPKYVVVDNGMGFGTVCGSNKVLFTANIADVLKDNTSGLDYSSAKIYVDGLALENVTASGNALTSEEVTLTSGIHEVIFEIADNMGNVTRNKEMLTVSGNKPIWIAGHNDSGALAEYDSIYYMDLKVADAAAISKVETEISLNFANTWQLPYMTVAEGFAVSYEFVELTNSVKLTITRQEDCTLTGEQTLVSIPVRIWSFPESMSATEKTMSTSGDRPIVPVDFEVEYGFVTYTAGNYDGYIGVFYDYFTTETKLQDDKYAWHLTHTAAAMADKAATCTEAGYTGRTYCDVCKSVVDWGTIVPATGHTYTITDGVLKCACGETFTGTWTDGKEYVDGIAAADGWNGDYYYKDGKKLTGIQVIDGFYYNFGEDGICIGQIKFTGLFYDESVSAYRYAKLGELYGGWAQIDSKWHYFDPTTKVAVTGEYKVGDVTFQFDQTGKTEGTWVTDDNGIRFWYGPDCYKARNYYQAKFIEIDGKTYNFDHSGYLTTGIHALYDDWTYMSRGQMRVWEFDENGVLVGEIITKGVVDNKRGGLYLVEEDGFVHGGIVGGELREYGGNYYFALYDGTLVTDATRWVSDSQANGWISAGNYVFGVDGKLFTGIKEGTDGVLYYYQEGKLGSGIYNSELVEINGSIYLVKNSGKIAVNETRTVSGSKTNGLLAAGTYVFGADGKLFTGIKEGADGVLYYYQDGKIGKGVYNSELVEIDGSIYLVKFSGKVAVNETRTVPKSRTNGLLAAGTYVFGADGKLFTGIKEGTDGVLYYYQDGKIGKGVYNSELVEIDGSIYLVKFSGKVAVNETRTVPKSRTNGLLAAGTYVFGADGKLFTGIKEDADGVLYYYQDGKIGKGVYDSELVEIDGSIYLVKFSGKVAVNETRTVPGSKTNGLISAGTYAFGADGKLVK